MSLSRRQLLAGAAGLAGSLILPPTLEENAEAAQRWWALGRVPSYGSWNPVTVTISDLNVMQIRHRTTPTGIEEHIDWVHPDYRDTLRITPAPRGGFTIDFIGVPD